MGSLDAIAAKVDAGEWLTEVDAQELIATTDIITLGMLADEVRRRLHGNQVTFVRVERVEDAAAVRDQGTDGSLPTTGEVRLCLVPDSIDGAVAAVQQIVVRAGQLPVSAFSLRDLARVADTAGLSLRSCLEQLKRAGLTQVAEVPLDSQFDFEGGLAAAAEAGIGTPRATIDTSADDWLKRVERLNRSQDRSRLVRAFSPLPSRPDSAAPTTGYEDLKRVSIARLLCAGTIDTIQIDWRLYGPKLAQVALTFGANDLDNVPAADDLSLGPRRATLEEVQRNIRAASFVPVERNGRWEPLRSSLVGQP